MKYKILIIDDEEMILSMMEKCLSDKFLVYTADSAKRALELLSATPDIILLDINMPEMDGLEALREIKKIDPGASVVMVSALGQEARMKEAIIYGAKGFIVKPFKEEMLISALSKL